MARLPDVSGATCLILFPSWFWQGSAIDRAYQGKSLGRALFKDAASRVMHAADAIRNQGIVVHAISEEAKAFYLAIGFDPSPLDPMTLMVTLADVRGAFA